MDGFAGLPPPPTHSVCRVSDHQEGMERGRKGQLSQSVGGMQDVHLQALQALKTPRSRSREADREAQRRIQKNGTRTQDKRERIRRRTETSWDTWGLEHNQDEFQLQASVQYALSRSRTGHTYKAYEDNDFHFLKTDCIIVIMQQNVINCNKCMCH